MLPIARVGDKHVCPICGPNVITSGGTSLCDNKPVARVGDTTACGATIVLGSSMVNEQGRPIAYLGSTTSHGGVIASGSPTNKILP